MEEKFFRDKINEETLRTRQRLQNVNELERDLNQRREKNKIEKEKLQNQDLNNFTDTLTGDPNHYGFRAKEASRSQVR